jgi:hypothetical protein
VEERRIEKLKKLLEELVPEDIDYRSYVGELESQWVTDRKKLAGLPQGL